MIAISSSVGLWIVEAYRRMSAQLQFIRVKDGKLEEFSVAISESTPFGPKICLAFLDDPCAQKAKCWLSLSDVKFWFDATGDSADTEGFPTGKWRSFLRIEPPDATPILLGERFIA